MKKVLILFIALASLKSLPSHAASFNVLAPAYDQDTEPERLMKLFLSTIQSTNDNDAKKFIAENYSKRFLEIPLKIHLKVINDLHRDFSHYVITQLLKTENKITVVIKSPINKTKQITIETDKSLPAKIFIIDVKDANQ